VKGLLGGEAVGVPIEDVSLLQEAEAPACSLGALRDLGADPEDGEQRDQKTEMIVRSPSAQPFPEGQGGGEVVIEMFVGERSRQYAVEELAEEDRLRSLRWIQVHAMAWLETSHFLDPNEIPAWALAERDLHLRERTKLLTDQIPSVRRLGH
jgi:hypothetical protein